MISVLEPTPSSRRRPTSPSNQDAPIQPDAPIQDAPIQDAQLQGDPLQGVQDPAVQAQGRARSRGMQKEAGQALDISPLPAAAAEPIVQLFKLLADETRLQILYFLTQRKELNVGALCELLHQSQPAVSHHLALMRLAGLIEMRREGKHNFYRLQPRKFQEHGRLLFELLPPAARLWLDDGRLVGAPAELDGHAPPATGHAHGRDGDAHGHDGDGHHAPRSDRGDSHE